MLGMRGRSILKTIDIHPETWVRIEDIGKDHHRYQTNFPIAQDGIEALHRAFRTRLETVPALAADERPGQVCGPTALKLIEIASCTHGNLIEFGGPDATATALMAMALRARLDRTPLRAASRFLHRSHLLRTDSDPERQARIGDALAALGPGEAVKFATAPATIAAYGMIELGRRYDVCFVAHRPAYEQMFALCTLLRDLVATNGFLLVNDYLPLGIGDGPQPEADLVHGIHAAVRDGLDRRRFAFVGCYGRSALFVRL